MALLPGTQIEAVEFVNYFPLMRLPREIRDLIMSYLLVSALPISMRAPAGGPHALGQYTIGSALNAISTNRAPVWLRALATIRPFPALALRRVSRDLYFEAGQVFYARNVFCAEDYRALTDFPRLLSPITTAWIRKLMITDKVLDMLGDRSRRLPLFLQQQSQAGITQALALLPQVREIEFLYEWSMRDPGIIQATIDLCNQVTTLEKVKISRPRSRRGFRGSERGAARIRSEDKRLQQYLRQRIARHAAARRAASAPEQSLEETRPRESERRASR